MNILEILSSIWSVKGKAALIAVAAAAAAILLTFHVSVSPPSLRPRAFQLGVAQSTVLIDSGVSPLADATVPYQDLSGLAEIYAALVGSPAVIDPVARSLAVNPADIAVSDQLALNVPLAVSDAREPQVGAQLLAARRHYSVLVRNDQGSPVLQIYTQAPRAGQAIRMANAVARSLAGYPGALAAAQGIAPARRVIVRQLGSATGGIVDRGLGRDAAILLAITFWGLGITALLCLRRLTVGRPARPTGPADSGSAPVGADPA